MKMVRGCCILFLFLLLGYRRLEASKCRVIPLSARSAIRAETILSASVESFYLGKSPGPFSGRVKVRRVFRGDRALEGRSILVEGLGSSKICVSTPRLGDTKLFFLDGEQGLKFRLHSSILKLNLRNLKVLWRMEQEENGTTGVASCQPECRFGAACKGGRCACDSSCPSKGTQICAKNGKTYKSKCELRLAECRNQAPIYPHSYGACPLIATAITTTTTTTTTMKPSCPSGSWRSDGVCMPCFCSSAGSESEQCDTVTGQCSCRAGYAGHGCHVCQGGSAGQPCRGPREVGFMSDRQQVTPGREVTVVGSIGHLCLADTDCSAKHAVCQQSVCECRPGFYKESSMVCRWKPPSPCSFSPCEAGGSCEDHDGTFTCHCRKGRRGRYCEQEATVDLKEQQTGFSGNSIIVIRYLPTTATRTSVELRFRSYASEGVILVARQRHATIGDFFSIAIVDSYVEVRYDLGSGAVTMTSTVPIQLGEWHRLTVERYRQDAMMRLDEDEPVMGKSRGRNKSLNLKGHAFIGGLPNGTTDSLVPVVGTTASFQGCLSDLKLRGRAVSLVGRGDPLIERTENLGDCTGYPCADLSCENGGSCAVVAGRARCECPKNFRGKRCQKKGKGRHHHSFKDNSESESASRGAVYFHHLPGGKKADYRKYQYDINT